MINKMIDRQLWVGQTLYLMINTSHLMINKIYIWWLTIPTIDD